MATEKSTTRERVATYVVVKPLLKTLFDEMKDLAKKKPDAPLSKTKIKIVNRLLEQCQLVLAVEPELKFLDLLDAEGAIAQASDAVLMIGQFVSAKLLDYVRTGDSTLSVNLPQCHLEFEEGSYRLMHIHHNVPGILRAINDILADRGINIERQSLNTRGTLGYSIYDINKPCDEELMRMLKMVPHTISVRAMCNEQ